ncbi:hypothetical protein PROVALCAL_01639 [Providencia alcalifaciens DSM 30120]|uniref:Uncharacterized protein n=1 Tax=Providencia alcalifaciens DSM 30120 TaxID=520999 RepID=B6XE63_9GAMM|nr:hypothetical protein PROVALCAL_01639 [Providencia alcalifaciens DSM 30120]
MIYTNLVYFQFIDGLAISLCGADGAEGLSFFRRTVQCPVRKTN